MGIEKWFGLRKKKEEELPKEGGVQHVTPESIAEADSLISNTDGVVEEDINAEHAKSVKAKGKSNWYRDEGPNDRSKVYNERQKEKLTDRHSDWKEKNPFEVPVDTTTDEVNEKNLDALHEIDNEADPMDMDENGDILIRHDKAA